jgi:hypothetical protein
MKLFLLVRREFFPKARVARAFLPRNRESSIWWRNTNLCAKLFQKHGRLIQTHFSKFSDSSQLVHPPLPLADTLGFALTSKAARPTASICMKLSTIFLPWNFAYFLFMYAL